MESLSPRMHERRHRWSRTRAPSAGWRERLLQKCMERVKAGREAAVALSRQQRYAILAQEAAGLRDVDRRPPALTTGEVNALIDELEAALDAERREAEQRALRDHQRAAAERDADVRELLDFHRRCGDGAAPGEVLCPVCSRDVLHVQHGVVFCRCGLRLDGGTNDNLTLELVRERLLEVIEEHAKGSCPRRRAPTFSCKDRFGFTFMHAYCDACDLDCIVL